MAKLQKQQEADRLAKLQKQQEADRLAQLQKQQEADRLAQLQKQQEADRLAQIQKQQEADRLARIQKQQEAAAQFIKSVRGTWMREEDDRTDKSRTRTREVLNIGGDCSGVLSRTVTTYARGYTGWKEVDNQTSQFTSAAMPPAASRVISILSSRRRAKRSSSAGTRSRGADNHGALVRALEVLC